MLGLHRTLDLSRDADTREGRQEFVRFRDEVAVVDEGRVVKDGVEQGVVQLTE